MTDVDLTWTSIQLGQHEAEWIGLETPQQLSEPTIGQCEIVDDDPIKAIRKAEKHICQDWGVIQSHEELTQHFKDYRARWWLLFGEPLPACIPAFAYHAIFQTLLHGIAAHYLMRYRVVPTVHKKYAELVHSLHSWSLIAKECF